MISAGLDPQSTSSLRPSDSETRPARLRRALLHPRLIRIGATVLTLLALSLYARMEWPWAVLGWVALVPWLAALDRTRSVRAACEAGMLMSLLFLPIVFGWFAESIHAYTGAPWAAGVAVMVLIGPITEPHYIVFAVARHLAQRAGAGFWRTAAVGACAYVGAEWASPKLFAETMGYGLYPSELLRQSADIAGAPGLTFILVMANECVLASIRALVPSGHARVSKREVLARSTRFSAWTPALFVTVSIVGLLVYGAVRLQQVEESSRSGEAVTAGLIQADISQYNRMAAEMGKFEAVRRILDGHFGLSHEALGRRALDFLVWPETVYPTTFGSPKSAAGADFDRDIAGFVVSTGVPLVFGSYDLEDGNEFNAAMFLEPASDHTVSFDVYRKASLFPLSERVPGVLESDLVRSWLPWLGSWKPGPGAKVLPLHLHDGRILLVAPLICYDALNPDLVIAAVRRGAEIIVTLSNDVWFGYGPAPHGHLVLAAFRSIETRRPQLRATNTGISGVITATGAIVASAGVHERAALIGTVTPERHATTLMLAWGDWLGPPALVAGLVLLTAPLLQRRGQTRSVMRPKPARARHRRR